MSPSTLRTCAGGHVVKNADIVGMSMTGIGGSLELFCIEHDGLFGSRLLSLGDVQLQV